MVKNPRTLSLPAVFEGNRFQTAPTSVSLQSAFAVPAYIPIVYPTPIMCIYSDHFALLIATLYLEGLVNCRGTDVA